MEIEKWKPVKGWEGLYEISSYGRLKSICRSRCQKGKLNAFGYLTYVLQHNCKKKYCMAHRLVAESFIPNPNNYPQVNHKDEIKTNNYVDNLEWCTAKYNINYGTCIKRRSFKQSLTTSLNKRVEQLSPEGEYINSFISISAAARYIGVDKSRISYVCKHPELLCKGYKWRTIVCA